MNIQGLPDPSIGTHVFLEATCQQTTFNGNLITVKKRNENVRGVLLANALISKIKR